MNKSAVTAASTEEPHQLRRGVGRHIPPPHEVGIRKKRGTSTCRAQPRERLAQPAAFVLPRVSLDPYGLRIDCAFDTVADTGQPALLSQVVVLAESNEDRRE